MECLKCMCWIQYWIDIIMNRNYKTWLWYRSMIDFELCADTLDCICFLMNLECHILAYGATKSHPIQSLCQTRKINEHCRIWLWYYSVIDADVFLIDKFLVALLGCRRNIINCHMSRNFKHDHDIELGFAQHFIKFMEFQNCHVI